MNIHYIIIIIIVIITIILFGGKILSKLNVLYTISTTHDDAMFFSLIVVL
jgi:hypothetical protein